ncbi:MAG: photosystem II manganese-stabilizing polypeptide [Jaaginema sp. PMC 1079.18]|nr:photosystem II manganese-stabilizing polypeptide [Jaaginema sp. PMC 1080.18]MEC4851721.1 photosystem II manganese-stabilizing polypeptide [Jaaginema sp. PMC 1079.18]MEC4868460.1 photosystem II manganese-stabilizing polypeptide [Jaaginema sp. PMC 1078.18]
MRYRAAIVAFLALCLSFLTACSDGAANATSPEGLTYDQILNTGLANICPQLSETTRGSIPIERGQKYLLTNLCIEPKEYYVKEESANKRRDAEFIKGRVLTRSTTTLDQIRGIIAVGNDGTLTFTEEDGIDFQPITVQIPGGEQFPFLFTVKNLVASTETPADSINASVDFEGSFKVPSYRGAVFLDPKGRGVASGYDNAVALPSQADRDEYLRANTKRTLPGEGEISLQVTKVDAATGEIAGVFESIQPSDTDLGADEPEDIKIQGIFYGILEPEAL